MPEALSGQQTDYEEVLAARNSILHEFDPVSCVAYKVGLKNK